MPPSVRARTLVYLPRSMARMVPAAVALAVVVTVQAPWGDGGGEVGYLSGYDTPRLAWILSAFSRSGEEGP
jgi:hypothetical protein